MAAEYKVENLIKMLQNGEKLYPWQEEIIRKDSYYLERDYHKSDLYCRGCGYKYGDGHKNTCVAYGL